jgi:hypothetical protein
MQWDRGSMSVSWVFAHCVVRKLYFHVSSLWGVEMRLTTFFSLCSILLYGQPWGVWFNTWLKRYLSVLEVSGYHFLSVLD